MPEEVRFFLRQAAFGLLIAVVYWFLTYESAGSVLLLAFGIGSALLTVVLVRQTRGRAGGGRWGAPWRWLALTPADQQSPTLEDEVTLPAGSLAPFQFGLGLALCSLALVFGAWFIAVGALPLLLGAASWVRAAMAEHRAASRAGEGVARAEEPATAAE